MSTTPGPTTSQSQISQSSKLSSRTEIDIEKFLADIRHEVLRSMTIFPTINSLHEGYAVILEELDEVWDQVKLKRENRDFQIIYHELVQVAAMALFTAITPDIKYK